MAGCHVHNNQYLEFMSDGRKKSLMKQTPFDTCFAPVFALASPSHESQKTIDQNTRVLLNVKKKKK